MKSISFVIFSLVLTIGSFETFNNEDYQWRANSNDMPANIEVKAYPNRQGKEKNRIDPSCLKHSALEEVQPEEPDITSPSRRSSTPTGDNKRFINYDSVPLPVSSFDNEFSTTYNDKPLMPYISATEDDLSDTQGPSEEVTRGASSNENLGNDNRMELTTPITETSPMTEILLTQELVAPAQAQKSNKKDTNELLSGPTSELVESPPVQQPECSGKSKNVGTIKPPRRFLGLTRDDETSTPDMNNNKGVTNNNFNTNTNNVDLPTLNKKLNTNHFYKVVEKSIQQVHENKPGSVQYLHNSNSYTKIRDPAKGEGISYVNKNTMMNILDYDRVCYACSTANNPTCWNPDRRTTVKYCRKSDNACVTKVFASENSFVLTRDCGSSCNENEMPGIVPKYQSCSICHKDLCNGSHSITVYSSILVLPTMIFLIFLKPLLVAS